MLSARHIGEKAERAALSLSLAHGTVFEAFYSYVIVDEPAVHLMPLHFFPIASRERVDEASLQDLAVAAKLEYARNRWLDELVDKPGPAAELSAEHRLNEALLGLIHARYSRVLDGTVAAEFFSVLSSLYACYGLSLVLDSTWCRNPTSALDFHEYAEHARMRHGPVRAPLDAVLLLVGADDELLQRARSSWHNWALGVQFYDDALDVEEDFRNRNLTWAVGRVLEYFHRRSHDFAIQTMPDPDTFYERALAEGVVSEALSHAESFFAESARLAESAFPSWVPFQKACVSQARCLREDYEKLVKGSEIPEETRERN
jgi:hypothetical protein